MNPRIERGDGLDHGVDASMLALRASIIERIHSLILSLSLSSVALGVWGRRSLTFCQSTSGFVFAHIRFPVGTAGCQLQSMAIAIGK